MPSTQKALFLDVKSGPFVLHERPVPKPGHGQLLVRIESAGLNPVDWKVQKYGIFIETYPAIVGTDIAGFVEEVGEGSSGFSKGDRVVFQGSWAHDLAGYQQYTLTYAATTAKIPSHVSFDEAATIPVAIAAATAGYFLAPPHGGGLTHPFDPSTRGKYVGKPLVVLGGATSVGQYGQSVIYYPEQSLVSAKFTAIQLGKLSGFSPIFTTASTKHESFLKSLGATHVFDRNLSSAALREEITKITSSPVEVVYDAVSLADTQATGYNLLADGGRLILVLPSQVTDPVEGKSIYSVFGVWTLPHSKDLGELFYRSLTGLLETGDIKPNRVEVVPGGLGGIASGLKRLELDQVSGVKLVVHPQDTA
ncbi:hypothetical protein H0H87_012047 [Tephrocybe sp. NHM501043]|nr:hypothetical protein H0H87_012047 [Tephrocybe sp. NHM501043]